MKVVNYFLTVKKEWTHLLQIQLLAIISFFISVELWVSISQSSF